MFIRFYAFYFNKAQDNTILKNEVNLCVVQLFGGNFRLGYEYMINNKYSVTSYGSFIMYSDDVYETMGGSIEAQFRFYSVPKSNNWMKLYFTPYFMYKYLDEHDKQLNLITNKSMIYRSNFYHIYSSGVMTGMKFKIQANFIVDISLGGGIRMTKNPQSSTIIHTDNGIFSIDYSGITPRANLSLGYMF